ncbi:protein kinase domain-containing protein, partial [Corynebacterium vitaeruminis]
MTMLTVGDVLEGRYKIEAPIARGGMSTVYRCIDLRLGRNVAAKVMDDRYVDDPIFRQRFKREARSMAQLSHPQLVGVYDFSSTGEHIFLIMELITGGTLRELLAERGPMPP